MVDVETTPLKFVEVGHVFAGSLTDTSKSKHLLAHNVKYGMVVIAAKRGNAYVFILFIYSIYLFVLCW